MMALLSIRVVTAGAGGFIGGHLTARLLREGLEVRAIDNKPTESWQQLHVGADNLVGDLRDVGFCERALTGASQVFNLACDMGGIGFIENNRALCMVSVLINTQLLCAARKHGVEKFFFASSACVYPTYLQNDPHAFGLKEHQAYPALPEDGYGWEKLFSERLCMHFREDFGLETRIARYHNVYGPCGTWEGGREKAPAAVCRKVGEAVLDGSPEIEVWGDGLQRRSFMHVDDCVEGTLRLMASDLRDPVNLGSDESVSIEELISVTEDIAKVKLRRRYVPAAPQGVRGRNSDNSNVRLRLGWQPRISLREGLEETYFWVFDQLRKKRGLLNE